MAQRTESERFRIRLRVLLGLMLALHGGLLTYLWNLQVVRGHTFQDNIRRQSLRRIRHPGQRGVIFDRNQILLADNRPSHCIALYPG
jgi:penicillin-binding protein 2